jgi:Tannase and feruloyl esterase
MSGPRNPRTGRPIYPGYFTSAAAAAGSWGAWITGPAAPGASIQAFFGNQFFGRIVYEIPAPTPWDFKTFNFDSDMAFTDAKTEDIFNATDPTLRGLRKRGGKIIMWHGWEDPAISGWDAVNYYNDVVRAQARRGGKTGDFFRLFMVPGMLHCGGGPGPNAFGQSLPQATPLSSDPDHDILSALERWVEKGEAPSKIIAAKYVNDNPALGVARTRPLCVYPKVAVYQGSGSTDDAANFECRRPRHHAPHHGHDDDWAGR